MADSIGAVIIDVRSDISYLVAGMQRAEGVVENSASVMINTAKLVATAYASISFKNLIDESAKLADQAGKMAEKYAIGVEELTKWHYTANSVAVTQNQFNDSLKDMSKNITDFQRDGSGADKAFKSLGITQEFAKEKMTNTSKSMEILLQKLGEMPKSMERTTIAMELFGEEGSNMIRVADIGASEIKKLNDEAIKGNIAVSNAFYEKSAAYASAHDRLQKLQGGFADAVIEESKFLEAGTSMYSQLAEKQLDWTASVQSGNNIFINGLEEISTGAYAVFPEVIGMSENLGNAVVTTGTAVVELADVAFSPLIDMLGLFFGAGNENITMLGTLSAYAMGSTMAIENFSTLIRLGVSELEVFAIYIESKVMSSLSGLTGSLLGASANVAEFINMVSFGEFGGEYERLALEAEAYTIQSEKSSLQGEIEIGVLRKKQLALVNNIHTIEDIDLAMETTAINVSLRQKEGLDLEIKKQEAYESTALTGMKSLADLESSSKAHTKALKANEKAYKEAQKAIEAKEKAQKKAEEERTKALEKFEDVYKKSTYSTFAYNLELLEKEKSEYENIGAEKLKVDAWYNVEFAKLEDDKNKILQDSWDKANSQQKELFENSVNAKKEFLRIMGDFETLDKMENEEILIDLKPYFSESDFNKVKNKLAELTEAPSFSDGIADAFNVDLNKGLKDTLDELGNRIGLSAKDALDSIIINLQNGMSVTDATTEGINSTLGGVYDGMKDSSNPYVAAAGYAIDFIEILGTDIKELDVNQHADNTAIIDAMDTLNDVMYPHLTLTKKMSGHLENMDSNFNSIASTMFYGNTDANGSSFEDSFDGLGNTTLLGEIAGGFVGDLLTGIGNAIYGKKVSLKNAGLYFGEQTIDAMLEGVDVSEYENINTTKRVFGVKVSDKDSVSYSDVTNTTQSDFNSIMLSGYDSILLAAEALDISSATQTLSALSLEEAYLDFKDKSEEEIKTLLQGEISSRFSTMAQAVGEETLARFRDPGQEYYDLLIEVGVGFEQGKEALDRLGLSIVDLEDVSSSGDIATETLRAGIEAFEGLSGIGDIVTNFDGSMVELIDTYETLTDVQFDLQSIYGSTIELTQGMINGFGGTITEFESAKDGFVSSYFTDQEQNTIALNALNKEFERTGVILPESTDAFRSWMESVTDNDELYGWGLSIAEEFYDVTTAITDYTSDLATNVSDAWMGSLSYLNANQKTAYATGYYELAQTTDAIDSVESARLLAEAAQETTKSQREYQPIFDNYVKELQNQEKDASNADLLEELKNLRQEVLELKEATYETARVG